MFSDASSTMLRRGHRFRAVVVALALAMLATVLVPGRAWAASSFLVAAELDRPAAKAQEVFFTAVFSVETGSRRVVLAGDAAGTGELYADDILEIVVTHGDDGSYASYRHDYSNGCDGITLYPTPPVDLSRLLHAGGNTVRIAMRDGCGENVGNTNLYLVGDGRFKAGAFVPFLPRYVAMGDSFASGEGAPPYDYTTTRDGCHRSSRAGAVLFAANPGSGPGPLSVRHVACTGAKIPNIYNGQNGEPPQLQMLDPATGFVSISIGGNDLGFVPVITFCITQAQIARTCAGQLEGRMQEYLRGLDTPRSDLRGYTPLQLVYKNIQVRAPRAKVLVVGYPYLFSPNGGVGPGTRPGLVTCDGVGLSDQRWINSVVRQGNAIIKKNAESVGATYVDLASPGVPGSFYSHALCDSSSDFLNNIVVRRGGPATESFHPNFLGQQAISKALAAGYARATAR